MISPPYFHPMQAAAAVAAGKHVYVAKPIAVDVPGCTSIQDSAAKATANKQCFLIDFQTRANDFFIEALRRVHDGAIGTFAFGESTYHAETRSKTKRDLVKAGTPEGILRAWGLRASCRATSSPSRTSTRSTSRAGSWASRRCRRTGPVGASIGPSGPATTPSASCISTRTLSA